jgi:hypothetical protein
MVWCFRSLANAFGKKNSIVAPATASWNPEQGTSRAYIEHAAVLAVEPTATQARPILLVCIETLTEVQGDHVFEYESKYYL